MTTVNFDYDYASCDVSPLITQNGAADEAFVRFVYWLMVRAAVMGAHYALANREVPADFASIVFNAYGVEFVSSSPPGAKVFTYVPATGTAWPEQSVEALRLWGSKLYLTQAAIDGRLPFPTVPRKIVAKKDAGDIKLPAYIQAIHSDGGINAGAVRTREELRELLAVISDEYVLVAPLLNVPIAPAAVFVDGMLAGLSGNIRPYGEGGTTGTFAPLQSTLSLLKPRWYKDMQRYASVAGIKVLEEVDSQHYPPWFNVDFLVVQEGWKPLFFSQALVTEVNGRLTQGSFGPRAVHMALRHAGADVPDFPEFVRALLSGKSGIAVIADDHFHFTGATSYQEIIARLEDAGLYMFSPERGLGWLPLTDPFFEGDDFGQVGFVVAVADLDGLDTHAASQISVDIHTEMCRALSGQPTKPIELY